MKNDPECPQGNVDSSPDTFAAGVEAAGNWHAYESKRLQELSGDPTYTYNTQYVFKVQSQFHREVALQISNIKREGAQ